MKKLVTLTAGFTLLFGATVASAQSYNSFYSVVNTGTCTNLTSDLTVGSHGTQVRGLQSFLVAQNYPGGGSWMITGNFGQATAAAVRNFQQVSGLPITGWVDYATRAAINQSSCGAGYAYSYNNYVPNYTTPSNNYYNNIYPYNYNYNYPYANNNNCGVYPYFYSCPNNYFGSIGSAPTLTSISPTYAMPGTLVTVYGSGFDYVNNAVYVGGSTLHNIASYNGTMLTFTVPANVSGSVSVSIGNTFGVSNALTLQSGIAPVVCNGYPYGQYGYVNNNCPPATNGQITIYPSSGGVGTNVTVYGLNFTPMNNTVHFGNGIIAGLSSSDGRSVSFTVPTSISGFGYQPIGLGVYNVSVTSGAGQTSPSVPFTITSLGGSGNNLAPTITSVSGPTSLQVNAQGVWNVQINNNQTNSYTTTSVNWGDQNVYGTSLSANQTTYAQGNQMVSFTHTYATTGTYTVVFTVTGINGLSNTSSVTVNVGSSVSGNVSLSMLSPMAGHVGTQVVLYGSGFTANDNTVHFGQGGMLHAISQNNGSNIYFTIPSYISSCDINPGTNCIYAQPVSAGSYPMYVSNANGTTQVINFQVQ